jgi:hypothetical protein
MKLSLAAVSNAKFPDKIKYKDYLDPFAQTADAATIGTMLLELRVCLLAYLSGLGYMPFIR